MTNTYTIPRPIMRENNTNLGGWPGPIERVCRVCGAKVRTHCRNRRAKVACRECGGTAERIEETRNGQ